MCPWSAGIKGKPFSAKAKGAASQAALRSPGQSKVARFPLQLSALRPTQRSGTAHLQEPASFAEFSSLHKCSQDHTAPPRAGGVRVRAGRRLQFTDWSDPRGGHRLHFLPGQPAPRHTQRTRFGGRRCKMPLLSRNLFILQIPDAGGAGFKMRACFSTFSHFWRIPTRYTLPQSVPCRRLDTPCGWWGG